MSHEGECVFVEWNWYDFCEKQNAHEENYIEQNQQIKKPKRFIITIYCKCENDIEGQDPRCDQIQ